MSNYISEMFRTFTMTDLQLQTGLAYTALRNIRDGHGLARVRTVEKLAAWLRKPANKVRLEIRAHQQATRGEEVSDVE